MISEYKILIFGGSGVLGKELITYCKNNNIDCYFPERSICDMLHSNQLVETIEKYEPTHIIHAAGLIDTIKCENNPAQSIDINITSTINLVNACINKTIKLVYISSEYVFSGNRGLYEITDKLDPINVYGKTKAASEYIISIAKSYQILRVPFIKKIHPHVFDNQICSRYFVNEVPEKIIKNILYNNENIVHISSIRMRLGDIYQDKKIPFSYIPISKDIQSIIPIDTSLVNTNKYE